MSRPKITQAQFALRLYRGILRSHRARLPADMRALGDRYVRQEFKAHKDAAPEHLRKFFPEWLAYLEALQEASPDELQNIGKDMSQEQVQAMSDEQFEMMSKMRQNAWEVGVLSDDILRK